MSIAALHFWLNLGLPFTALRHTCHQCAEAPKTPPQLTHYIVARWTYHWEVGVAGKILRYCDRVILCSKPRGVSGNAPPHFVKPRTHHVQDDMPPAAWDVHCLPWALQQTRGPRQSHPAHQDTHTRRNSPTWTNSSGGSIGYSLLCVRGYTCANQLQCNKGGVLGAQQASGPDSSMDIPDGFRILALEWLNELTGSGRGEQAPPLVAAYQSVPRRSAQRINVYARACECRIPSLSTRPN